MHKTDNAFLIHTNNAVTCVTKTNIYLFLVPWMSD